MSHMVIYRSSDGKPGYQQVEQLEEAIRFVERLRNEEGVTEAKLYNLVEVPISFKTYYQVEVGNGSAAPAPAPAAEPTPSPEPVPASGPAPASSPEPAKASAPEAPEVAAPAAVKPGAPVAAVAASKPEDKQPEPSANGGRFGLFGKS